MATTINADTSNGLKITSDTSGVIEFQSAGTTKAGVNSTGLTGDGSQLTGISSVPTNLQITKAVTGAVTALRAVSNAASTGNVGVYPVGNTLGSITNTTMAPLIMNNGTGKTAIKVAAGNRYASNTSRWETVIYGQYLNGSNVWVNNATPLTLVSPSALGSGANYEIDNGTAFVWRTPDGYLQIAACARGNNGTYATAGVVLYTIDVNTSTGAPSIVGTARQATFGVGVSTGGAGTSSFAVKVYGEDRVQIRLQANTYGYFEFFYTSGAGWAAATTSDVTRYDYTYGYAMNSTSNNADNNETQYSRKSALENAAANKLIQTAPNAIRTLVVASHVLQSTTPVNVTLSADYASDGQTTMLDSTHCLQIYVDSGGERKIKTFTIAADGSSVSLIDTFVLPSGFESTDQFIFKDSKNFVIVKYPTGIVNSVGLAADFSVDGVNIKSTGLGPIQVNYSGSGNVFNVWSLLLGIYGFQTYTVNAFSTPPFNYGGVAAATASSGNVSVYVAGVVPGYTGMTVNAVFYVNNTFDGTFTNNANLGTPRVGKAISQTEILLGEVL